MEVKIINDIKVFGMNIYKGDTVHWNNESIKKGLVTVVSDDEVCYTPISFKLLGKTWSEFKKELEKLNK